MGKVICFFFVFLFTGAMIAQDTLTIATWNVFLRPAILTDNQKDRVVPISNAIIEYNADVVCLQEVFHARSRKKLIQELNDVYPHYLLPGRAGMKQCSGLMIFSKHRIVYDTIGYYRSGSGIDAAARKGAQLVKIAIEGGEIIVVNTHLQAGNQPKQQRVRNKQYQQLKEISENHRALSYWIAGDFNTSVDSSSFSLLKKSVMGEEGSELRSKEKFTSNFADNGLFESDGSGPRRIDFIFVKAQSDWSRIDQRIHRPKSTWRKRGGHYLSDHAYVESTFVRSKN